MTVSLSTALAPHPAPSPQTGRGRQSPLASYGTGGLGFGEECRERGTDLCDPRSERSTSLQFKFIDVFVNLI